MKQLVILSGKGGTGKTSLAAAFAHLAHEGSSPLQVVLADADVDAANLELVLRHQKMERHDFIGGAVAVIDPTLCRDCGVCEQVCRFEAIISADGAGYSIDPIACEGCAACVYQCPESAIRMQPQHVGQWYRSESRYGPLFHADLRPAQENSGKLVTLVKQNARLCAIDGGYPLVMVDGPPGIGCPVIAAAAGADLALVVTEPTAASIHDLSRALQTTLHFRIPAWVVINKADLYAEGAAEIMAVCLAQHIEVIGSIPFDPTVTEAMLAGEPVTVYQPDAPASQALAYLWRIVASRLGLSESKS